MKKILAALLLIASCVVAAAQGCGNNNPSCIVPTAPYGTSDNRAASTAFVQNAINGLAGSGGPIFILATGQSNFVETPTYSWTPARNVSRWNNADVDGSVGTAFAPLSNTTINVSDKFASDIAIAYPNRHVYLLNFSIGSQTIAHWMVGTSAPDMYANILANITPALAAAGVTKINTFLWWQGENQTNQPELYVSNFNTVQTRFQGETWFPRSTPVVIYGLAPESISTFAAALNTNTSNKYLQDSTVSESDTRMYVYNGILDSSYWDASVHLNGLGMFTSGNLSANAYLYGPKDIPVVDPIRKVINSEVIGRPAYRNLVIGGDLTTNPWRYGTSFPAATTGTDFAQNFQWIQSGAGVVTVQRAASAPTIANAGMFTQNSIDIEVTTADASLAGVDYYGIEHNITALSTSFLGYGQTNALSVTVSFWVNHTLPGNYFVYLENEGRTMSYVTQYVVNTANTWEKKIVTITGPPTGTWPYTTGTGLKIGFPVASSDNYLFTPNVWNVGDVRVGNATRVNGLSTIGNHFRVALIQFEEGLGASSFEQLPQRVTTAPLISIDGTLAGNSDSVISTEKAVRTYADAGFVIVNASIAAEAALARNANNLSSGTVAVARGGTGAGTAIAAMASLKGVYTVGSSAVPVSVTGTVAETTLATISIPANSMGANGAVRITTLWSNNNPGANGTYRIKYNGTLMRSVTTTNTVFSGRTQVEIHNRNATNSQVSAPTDQANWNTSVSALVTSAHDTTGALNITITGQLGNTGDTITSESYLVELIVP